MAFKLFQKDAQYLPVHQEEKIGVADDSQSLNSMSQGSIDVYQKKRFSGFRYSLWIPWILVLSLMISNVYFWKTYRDQKIVDMVFSPATSAIKYKNRVASSGVLNEISPYQGRPSESNNALWEDLFNFGISRIPMSQAEKLVNRTVPISNDPGYYAVTLDVFHQLHCLNKLRQQIWSDSPMPEDGPLNALHMDHCLDSIRQSLMCASDTTPLPYAWYTYYQLNLPQTGVVRTCRDFNALRDWAKERQSYDFNASIYVDDPLGNVIVEPVDLNDEKR